MVKQITEQVDILSEHVKCGPVDLEFISLHAWHISQLAAFVRKEQLAEVAKRQEEFLQLLKL